MFLTGNNIPQNVNYLTLGAKQISQYNYDTLYQTSKYISIA